MKQMDLASLYERASLTFKVMNFVAPSPSRTTNCANFWEQKLSPPSEAKVRLRT